MEVLVLTDKPWHDPAALWSCGRRDDHLLLFVGSEKDRVCLALTQEELTDMLGRWAALMPQQADTPA